MKNTFITLLLLIFTAYFAKAQMLDTGYEKQASFKGGDAASFAKWVTKRIKYPELCTQEGIEGTVIARFRVKYDGSVDSVWISRGVHPLLDKEVKRVIETSPKWTPAENEDGPVNLIFTLPIIFRTHTIQLSTKPDACTVAQFHSWKEKNKLFELSGMVTRIRNNAKGNLFIDDGTGSVLIYGVIDTISKRKFYDLDVRVGDYLTVCGFRSVYDGRIIEMKDAQYVRHIKSPFHNKVLRNDELDSNPSVMGMDTKGFAKWVSQQIVYPDDAYAAGIEGTVYVQFLIEPNGKLSNIKVEKSVHPSLDAEAVRAVSTSPDWSPGIVDNHPVLYRTAIPVVFKR